jgi:hypothetical protein
MKHSKFKNFSFSDSNLLSRQQMKMITGGKESVGGGSACVTNGTICATVGGVTYTCANIPASSSGGEECCCGHSHYNWACQA